MFTEKLPNENMVITMLIEGQESALKLIYDRYYSRIYTLAMQFLKSPEAAQEIVQDVFLKLWEKRESIDRDKPIEAWLYTVAKNKVFNQFKKVAREYATISQKNMPVEAVDNESKADSKVLNGEIEQLINAAINNLPEKQREVYRLSRIEGFSRNEIAEQLQISSLTVKTHMSRAIVSVKNFLQHKGVSMGCVSLILVLLNQ
jgi:RNA polymerase sigma-70 factor (ECF subfamily)